MKMRNLVLGLCFLAIGIAQGPLNDRIIVTLPYPVNVNGTTLQPGEYEIRQHDSVAGGSRIVHFYSDKGMKFQTTAMGIPALDNKTPEETSLILNHIDSDYYLNKIWVQGKNYGYEFPIPERVRLREKERNGSASIVGRYEASTAIAESKETIESESKSVTVESTETKTEIAQAAPPPVVEIQTAPAPVVVEQAQAQPEPAPAPAVTTTTTTTEYADRSSEPAMPATAGNWLSLLLGGGLMTSAGVALRRFRF